MDASAPILFFDSGVGGLSVLEPTLKLLPNAPIVYAAEVAVSISLLLGVFTRFFAAFGGLQILNLWLGLYNAPGEWPWTYFFLLVLQLMFAVHCYGRSLGIDALLAPAARGSQSSGLGSRLLGAAS